MAKKINKIIIYYEDGTYQEVTPGVHLTQGEENKKSPNPSPVTPDFRPDWQKIREWQPSTPYQPTWTPAGDPSLPPWTITCSTNTSTGNGAIDYKYTITSTGNGNVDISK